MLTSWSTQHQFNGGVRVFKVFTLFSDECNQTINRVQNHDIINLRTFLFDKNLTKKHFSVFWLFL